jgi:hypothetical protein
MFTIQIPETFFKVFNIGSLNICHNSTGHEIVLIHRLDRKTCLNGTLHFTGLLKEY